MWLFRTSTLTHPSPVSPFLFLLPHSTTRDTFASSRVINSARDGTEHKHTTPTTQDSHDGSLPACLTEFNVPVSPGSTSTASKANLLYGGAVTLITTEQDDHRSSLHHLYLDTDLFLTPPSLCLLTQVVSCLTHIFVALLQPMSLELRILHPICGCFGSERLLQCLLLSCLPECRSCMCS
jgi:hypothetical protein